MARDLRFTLELEEPNRDHLFCRKRLVEQDRRRFVATIRIHVVHDERARERRKRGWIARVTAILQATQWDERIH